MQPAPRDGRGAVPHGPDLLRCGARAVFSGCAPTPAPSRSTERSAAPARSSAPSRLATRRSPHASCASGRPSGSPTASTRTTSATTPSWRRWRRRPRPRSSPICWTDSRERSMGVPRRVSTCAGRLRTTTRPRSPSPSTISCSRTNGGRRTTRRRGATSQRFLASRHVFVEGLALIALAGARGWPLSDESTLCPFPACLGPNMAPVPDLYREIERLAAGCRRDRGLPPTL